MANRLTRIYTRTGDQGTTGLSGGLRVDKDHARIEAIGEVDELNSALALVLAGEMDTAVRHCLLQVQNDLFDLGGELALPEHPAIGADYIKRLEQELDRFNAALPPLKEFVLPAGGPAAAACHLARAICRRAERRLVSLARIEPLRPEALAYLNRLSDLLFVLARLLTRADREETLWRPGNRLS